MPKQAKDFILQICLVLFIINCCFANYNQARNSSQDIPLIPKDQLQDHIESLNQLIDQSKLDSAYHLGQQIVKASKIYKLLNTKAQGIYQLARIHNRQHKYEKSDTFLNTSLSICEDDDLSFKMLILSYNNAMRLGEFDNGKSKLSFAKSFIKDSTGINMVRYRYSLADYYNSVDDEHDKVLDLLLLAKKEAPVETDYKTLFKINYQLGALYAALDVHDQAIIVGEENESLALENQDFYLQLFGIYTQLSSYAGLKDHKNIYKLVHRAIKIEAEHDESTAFGYLYFVQGESYLEQGLLDSAYHYFQLGERISLERNSKLDLGNNCLGKSKVHFKRKDFTKAIEYADKAKKAYPEGVDGLEQMYWELAAVNGNYESAYAGAVKSLNQTNEEIDADNTYAIISRLLDDKFSSEQETQRIELVKNERKNKLFLALCLVAALISFLIITAIIQARNRKKLEDLNTSLTKRNEALTNFSYISSHDLKEPVRNIVSFSELLEKNLKDSPSKSKELEFATIIKNSSNTLLEIVKSLKIFSETAFDDEIQLDEFDIGDVFNDLKTNMQQLISVKNAEVIFTNSENVSSIVFSKPMLYLLLQNLIQNGLKYNESTLPIVSVDVVNGAKGYLFKVKDNGKGIALEKLEYIFMPFKTLQSKSLSQSSGLGLSICKNILDKFGGKIWVESSLGEGSSFYFSIPKTLKHV